MHHGQLIFQLLFESLIADVWYSVNVLDISTRDVMDSESESDTFPNLSNTQIPIVSDSKFLFRSTSTSLNNSTSTDAEI